jgi:hypothetical protein
LTMIKAVLERLRHINVHWAGVWVDLNKLQGCVQTMLLPSLCPNFGRWFFIKWTWNHWCSWCIKLAGARDMFSRWVRRQRKKTKSERGTVCIFFFSQLRSCRLLLHVY